MSTRGRHQGFWDEDKVQRIRDLFQAGLSPRAVADLLGTTKSSVIGKCHRQNIEIPERSRAAISKAATDRLKRKRRQPLPPSLVRTVKPKVETAPVPRPRAEDVPRKTLIELECGECKFPVDYVSKPGFGFCALPQVPGLPYCADHAARCYVPVMTKAQRDKAKEVMDASKDVSRYVSKLVVAGE
jgi:GcrA cell cycle regulator